MKEERKEDLISLGTNQRANHHHCLDHIFVRTSCFNSWKGCSKSRMNLLKHPKEKCDKKRRKESQYLFETKLQAKLRWENLTT